MSNLRSEAATKVSEHHPNLTHSRMGGRARCMCGWDTGLLRSMSKDTNMRTVVSRLWADHVREEIRNG